MPALTHMIDLFMHKLARRRRRRLPLAQILLRFFPCFPFFLIRHRVLLHFS